MSKWKDISKIDAHIHLTPDDVIEANRGYDGKFIVNGAAIDYITMGKTINEFYESNLPEDLRIVSLKYNKLGRLPMIRLEIGAK